MLRFTAEMSVLLKAGLPLDRAIKVQIESASEGVQKSLLEELLDALKGGKALSAGLEKRPDVFNHFYVNMVRSGEASGHLADVLAELAAYFTHCKLQNIHASLSLRSAMSIFYKLKNLGTAAAFLEAFMPFLMARVPLGF